MNEQKIKDDLTERSRIYAINWRCASRPTRKNDSHESEKMAETRICKTCEIPKPIESFPRRSGRSAHLREHTCGMCKKRASIARNPGKARDAKDAETVRRRAKERGITPDEYRIQRQARKDQAARRRLNADIKLRKNIRTRCPLLSANPSLYYLVNAEKKKAESRRYYQLHLEKSRSRVRRWKSFNPAAVSAQRYRRRVNMKNAVTDLTNDQWQTIKAAYRNRCAYCGRKRPLTMDHVIPVSKGGAHTAANIVPACQSCNSSKSTRPPLVEYQPHLIV